MKKKKQFTNGGNTLASIPGYHKLLAARSHGTISKKEFARQSKILLATLNGNGKSHR